MRFRSRALVWRGLLLAVLLLALPGPVRAQETTPGPFREPGISYMEQQSPYIQWLAGTLIVVACLLVAFKNPHRSHLD